MEELPQTEEEFYRESLATQLVLYLLCVVAGIALFPLTVTFTALLFGLTIPYSSAVMPTIGLIALYSAFRAMRGVIE